MGRFSGWLLAADFDGTFRPEGEGAPIPPENRAAAERFMAEGGLFTIATGRDARSYLHIRPHFTANAPVILSNGAVIFDGDALESVYESFLPFSCRDDLRQVLSAFPGTGMEVHRGADILVTARTGGVEEHLREIEVSVREAEPERILFPWTQVVLVAEGPLLGENRIASSIVEWIAGRFPGRYEAAATGALVDVVCAGNDKGSGVRRLAEWMEIPPERVVCVGDGMNDIPMLRIAGRAFAPAGAVEPVRTLPGVTVVGPCGVCLRDVVDRLWEEVGSGRGK